MNHLIKLTQPIGHTPKRTQKLRQLCVFTHIDVSAGIRQFFEDSFLAAPGGGEENRRRAVRRRKIDIHPGTQAKVDSGAISGARRHVE